LHTNFLPGLLPFGKEVSPPPPTPDSQGRRHQGVTLVRNQELIILILALPCVFDLHHWSCWRATEIRTLGLAYYTDNPTKSGQQPQASLWDLR
jgi:hypothetical protein